MPRLADYRLDAYVFGGPTGSHMLGHAERPWDKLHRIEQSGYIQLSVARQRGNIPADWQPPEQEAMRDPYVREVLRKKLPNNERVQQLPETRRCTRSGFTAVQTRRWNPGERQ